MVRFKTKIREIIIVHNNKTQDYNVFFYLKNFEKQILQCESEVRQRTRTERGLWTKEMGTELEGGEDTID
jgi:hypothetical protein